MGTTKTLVDYSPAERAAYRAGWLECQRSVWRMCFKRTAPGYLSPEMLRLIVWSLDAPKTTEEWPVVND